MEWQVKADTGTLTSSKRFRDVAEKAITRMEQELSMGGGKVVYKDYVNALRKYHVPFFDRTYITSVDLPKLNEFNLWRTKLAGKQLSKSTILNHNAAMNMVFQEATTNQWMHPLQVPELSNVGTAGGQTNPWYYAPTQYYCLPTA